MSYSVKEIFHSLQGEGANAGRAAVFCRFSGCDLWSGREEDRREAACGFCDTDFRGTDGAGGGLFADSAALADTLAAAWTGNPGRRMVVLTGGEPLLQLDAPLIDALHDRGFFIAIETNGTHLVPEGIDWICVSPKGQTMLRQRAGSELKLVFPQDKARPEMFETMAFDHFWLQPMDGPGLDGNVQAAIAYCLAHPVWRLSLQIHKYLGIR